MATVLLHHSVLLRRPGPQSADPLAAGVGDLHSFSHPRSECGPLRGRPHRGHVPGPDRGGHGRGHLPAAPPPLHRGAAQRRPRAAGGPRVLNGEPASPAQVPTGCSFHPRCRLAHEECAELAPSSGREDRHPRHAAVPGPAVTTPWRSIRPSGTRTAVPGSRSVGSARIGRTAGATRSRLDLVAIVLLVLVTVLALVGPLLAKYPPNVPAGAPLSPPFHGGFLLGDVVVPPGTVRRIAGEWCPQRGRS